MKLSASSFLSGKRSWIKKGLPLLVAAASLGATVPLLFPIKGDASIDGPLSHSSSMQIDPFYLKLYQAGEKDFRAGNYAGAAGNLEIAVFGLTKNEDLTGKAHLLLSVCYYYRAEREKSRQSLMTASRFIKADAIRDLDLKANILDLLEKLSNDYQVDLDLPAPRSERPSEKKPVEVEIPTEKKAETTPPVTEPPPKPAAKKTPPAETKLDVNTTGQKAKPKPEEKTGASFLSEPPLVSGIDPAALRERLRVEPENTALVHELISFYFMRGNYKDARKVLESFVARNPDDLPAAYLLAKSRFLLGDYKLALREFNKLRRPAAETLLGDDLNRRTLIYIALCLGQLDQIRSVSPFLDILLSITSSAELSSILKEEGLTDSWREMLARIEKDSD